MSVIHLEAGSSERASAPDAEAPREEADTTAEALGLREPRMPGRECEKLGLIEIVLLRERYGSILEIGCGRGGLAGLLADRCVWYTGMDAGAEALAIARAEALSSAMRFVPLTLPLSLPRGEHELVVLREVLHLLERGALEDIARRLAAHAPCEEIVVVGARDEHSGERDPTLDAFAAALGGGFVLEELAMRRHYRIDALLRR